jgi:hypothetical protein
MIKASGPRDFRNARRLLPSVTPPRLKFQGYVDFRLNPLIASQFDSSQNARLQMSSLVQRASLPQVTFDTNIRRQYNMRRVTHRSVSYTSVSITVVDTVNSEWMTMCMNYFGYHYMNPRNRGSDRLLKPFPGQADLLSSPSEFGASAGGDQAFDSNSAGFNLNLDSSFFDQIDIILYHGAKGVQYSLIRPTMTSFKFDDLDYSATSEFMKIEMSFDYESFTVRNSVNFDLDNTDLSRFDSFSDIILPGTR